MKAFLDKLIKGHIAKPPLKVIQSLEQNFRNAINVEWQNNKSEKYYEAVFYNENLEHIAFFDPSGILIEHRINLPLESLPLKIKELSEKKGEIMNSVMRNTGNKVEYEVIVRNSEFVRYILLYSAYGRLITKKQL